MKKGELFKCRFIKIGHILNRASHEYNCEFVLLNGWDARDERARTLKSIPRPGSVGRAELGTALPPILSLNFTVSLTVSLWHKYTQKHTYFLDHNIFNGRAADAYDVQGLWLWWWQWWYDTSTAQSSCTTNDKRTPLIWLYDIKIITRIINHELLSFQL